MKQPTKELDAELLAALAEDYKDDESVDYYYNRKNYLKIDEKWVRMCQKIDINKIDQLCFATDVFKGKRIYHVWHVSNHIGDTNMERLTIDQAKKINAEIDRLNGKEEKRMKNETNESKWLGYFEADSEEAKALVGKSVIASDCPLYLGRDVYCNVLKEIRENKHSLRYIVDGDIWAFIKKAELAPVNKNCLLKPVMAKMEDDEWRRVILISVPMFTDVKTWFVCPWDNNYGLQGETVISNAVKRCHDVVYGDENEE